MGCWSALEPKSSKLAIKIAYRRMARTVRGAIKEAEENKVNPLFKKGEIHSDYLKMIVGPQTLYLMNTGHLFSYNEDAKDVSVKKNDQILIPIIDIMLKYKVVDCGIGMESFYKSSLFE